MRKLTRRNFIKNSVLTSGGIILTPSIISCSSNDVNETDKSVDETIGFKKDKFHLGVASFDPTQDGVILWTRYNDTQVQQLTWQVALQADFNTVLRSGKVMTEVERDFTVSIKLESLNADQKLYYRFLNVATEQVSVVGETITLPKQANQIKLAVCSCSNYPVGYFNVYDAVSKSDADVVVHLGDYIYEYGKSSFDDNSSLPSLNRMHEPEKEIITLSEYRTRYKQYRLDKKLQLAHQKKPFICVWDDHEIANETYKGGAGNHSENEGDFNQRKTDAIKAFSEYIPMNITNINEIYRDFNLGGLVNLVMLDTRVIGRDKQLAYQDYFDTTGNFNQEEFVKDWQNPSRSILGETQKDWLINTVNSSSAKWQVLGQQVLMGKMMIPSELLLTLLKSQQELSRSGNTAPETLERLNQQMQELILIKLRITNNDPSVTVQDKARVENVLPFNLDAWDGYPAERENIYNQLSNKNVIALAGDTHNAWQNSLTNNQGTKIGEELATASVSSYGFSRILGNEANNISRFELAFPLLVDDLNYLNASERGFLEVTYTSSSVKSDWVFVDTIFSESYQSNIKKTINFN